MTFKKQNENKSTTGKKTKWKKIGAILKSKNSNGFYIKVDESVSLAKGQIINVQNPRERVQSLMDTGKISTQEAEIRLAKIPDFVRYELFLVE